MSDVLGLEVRWEYVSIIEVVSTRAICPYVNGQQNHCFVASEAVQKGTQYTRSVFLI